MRLKDELKSNIATSVWKCCEKFNKQINMPFITQVCVCTEQVSHFEHEFLKTNDSLDRPTNI